MSTDLKCPACGSSTKAYLKHDGTEYDSRYCIQQVRCNWKSVSNTRLKEKRPSELMTVKEALEAAQEQLVVRAINCSLPSDYNEICLMDYIENPETVDGE